MREPLDTDAGPNLPPSGNGIGEILPPGVSAPGSGSADTARALALVGRLTRGLPPSSDLQALLEGPLQHAARAAASYAEGAIAPATRDAYRRDWAEFAAWAGRTAPSLASCR